VLPASWQRILLVGVLIAVASAGFGQSAQIVVALLTFVTTTAGVLVGVIKRKPRSVSPWVTMSLAALLFFCNFASKVLDPKLRDTPSSGMTFGDFLGVIAYLVLTLGIYRLGLLRRNDKDPTNRIDAFVFVGAIGIVVCGLVVGPMIQSAVLTTSTKFTNGVFDALDLLLLFVFAQLAIGPGAKNASYRLLSLVPISILLSDQLIAMDQAQLSFPGDTTLELLLPTVGCVAGIASAFHPSMVEITEPADVPIGSMSTERFILMACSVLAGPLTLLIDPSHYWPWILPGWLLTTALVMLRFKGLVKAREQTAALDALLADGSAALVSSTTRPQLHKAALDAATRILELNLVSARASVIIKEDQQWRTVALRNWPRSMSRGALLDRALGAVLSQSSVGIINCEAGTVAFPDVELPSLGVTYLVPLLAQGVVRGALVFESGSAFLSNTCDVLCTLATHLALALEAAGLSEDLHNQRSDRRFRSLVENSTDILLVLGENGSPIFKSPAAERLLCWAGVPKNFFDAIHEADRAAFISLTGISRPNSASVTRRRTLEIRIVGEDGETRWLEATATDMRHEPEVAGIVVNAHDITERKSLENDLRHRVLHDDLTGIPNRVLLRDRIEHALSRRSGEGDNVAVLFIDLDDFKTVNDGLGHAAGDELLKVIAFRIDNFVRDHDTAARLGGDEFAVLLERLANKLEASLVADRLLDVIRQPLDFGGRQIQVSASVGIAFVEDGCDSGALLRNADVAMYDAKRSGKNCAAMFDESMYVNALERLDLKADLRSALERNEFMVYYQPLVHMGTGEISGFEALVRWNHPEKGFISPASFVPLAEETGAIVPLGMWVLRTALSQLIEWRAERPELQLKMSVNVAPRQLQESSIVSDVANALDETGVEPSWVTLELTESEGLDDPATRERLAQLARLGVGIAADDFGSGFASYAALQQLPFTVVKIDRSLLLGLETNYDKAVAQLQSIIDMAHSTGLDVVVEGIEEQRQLDLLTSMGCDRGQGFLMGRPVPVEVMRKLLVASSGQPACVSSKSGRS
jgi:diguanylate cyclase (GGDEF)-like protein/PAS domain S-box-containing protein